MYEDPEKREGKDDFSDRAADRPEIHRQSTPEQQQAELKHHRGALDGGVNFPLLESIQFPLPASALVCDGTTTVPEISIDPLFPQHHKKHDEERGASGKSRTYERPSFPTSFPCQIWALMTISLP